MEQILKIRKSGGASIASIPKPALESLGLSVGQDVKWSVKNHKLVLEPIETETLESLLVGVTREMMKPTEEERVWMGSEIGKELIV